MQLTRSKEAALSLPFSVWQSGVLLCEPLYHFLVFNHFDKNPFETSCSYSCSQNSLIIVDPKCMLTSLNMISYSTYSSKSCLWRSFFYSGKVIWKWPPLSLNTDFPCILRDICSLYWTRVISFPGCGRTSTLPYEWIIQCSVLLWQLVCHEGLPVRP